MGGGGAAGAGAATYASQNLAGVMEQCLTAGGAALDGSDDADSSKAFLLSITEAFRQTDSVITLFPLCPYVNAPCFSFRRKTFAVIRQCTKE